MSTLSGNNPWALRPNQKSYKSYSSYKSHWTSETNKTYETLRTYETNGIYETGKTNSQRAPGGLRRTESRR